MKAIIIWVGVFLFLCFVISIPMMEERHHIKQNARYMDGKYELKKEPLPQMTYGKLDSLPIVVNESTGTDFLN